MAITIKMTGYCKNCPVADLVLEALEVESFDTTPDKLWFIHCTHEGACERMFKGRYKNATEEI